MEKQININSEYDSLESILALVKKESPYACSLVYDSWDVRTDANGQMEKCVLIKKSGMHGMKVYFTQKNVLLMKYIIPSKIMNAYFGESKKARQGILEIVAGGLKKALLNGSQKKAFQEMEQVINKIAV